MYKIFSFSQNYISFYRLHCLHLRYRMLFQKRKIQCYLDTVHTVAGITHVRNLVHDSLYGNSKEKMKFDGTNKSFFSIFRLQEIFVRSLD